MTRHYQRGFNLIEVLVAMVVLSMGLLGIAALQLTGVRSTQGSYYRSQATSIMSDLAERIHANKINAVSYGGTSTSAVLTLSPSSCVIPSGTPALVVSDLNDVGCGANSAGNLMPSGVLKTYCIDNVSGVATACATDLRMDIEIDWTEQGAITNSASAVAADTAQSVVMTIQP